MVTSDVYNVLGAVGIEIWEYLPCEAILNLMLTSKDFLRVSKSLNQVVPLQINFEAYFRSHMVPARLTFIDNENKKAKRLISILKTFPMIYNLNIHRTYSYEDSCRRFGVSLLVLCRHDGLRRALKQLTISICCDEALCYISDLTNLVNLTLVASTNISKQGMIYLSSLTHLTRLSLIMCKSIKTTDFFYLSNLANLLELDLSHCEFVTNDVLAHVGKITKLKVLQLLDCARISDDGLEIIGEKLKCLVNLCIGLNDCITNDGVSKLLLGLPKLKLLDIQCCGLINDELVQYFALHHSLETIKIYGTKITLSEAAILIPELNIISDNNFHWSYRRGVQL